MPTFHYEDDGLSGTVTVYPLGGDSIGLELLISARHPFDASYDLRFVFPSRHQFHTRLKLIHARACNPKGGCSLDKTGWPHRPFKFMRPGARFLGTVRGLQRERNTRAWAIAAVFQGNREILEVSDRLGGETSFNLPITLLARLSEFLRKMDS